jgi:hypothetical protein
LNLSREFSHPNLALIVLIEGEVSCVKLFWHLFAWHCPR